MTFIRPGRNPLGDAPAFLQVASVCLIEGGGTADVTTTLASESSANLRLISIDAVLTSSFAGPPTLNNGNAFSGGDATPVLNEVYGPVFTQYSLRAWFVDQVLGGSPHSCTQSRTSATNGESTKALIALSGGPTSTVTVLASLHNAPGSEGQTLTSPTLNVTGSWGRAIFIDSGTGDVSAQAHTVTMLTAGWEPLFAFAKTSAEAPSGYVQMHAWTRALPPGSHSCQVRHDRNEGAIQAFILVQA